MVDKSLTFKEPVKITVSIADRIELYVENINNDIVFGVLVDRLNDVKTEWLCVICDKESYDKYNNQEITIYELAKIKNENYDVIFDYEGNVKSYKLIKEKRFDKVYKYLDRAYAVPLTFRTDYKHE